MPVVDAYAERRAAEVIQDTWGHLAPKPGEAYTGHVLFTLGCFGDLSVIRYDFGDLPDSPWFYEHLHEWIWDQKPEEGKVYRFDGAYCIDRAERFSGELQTIDL